MIGWRVGPKYRRWQARSRHEQVEASTRWMLVAYVWVMLLGFVVPLVPGGAGPGGQSQVPGGLSAALAWSVLGLGVVQCVLCTRLLGPAVESYLGARAVPRSRLAALTALLCAMSALTVVLVVRHAVHGPATAAMVLYGALAPFAAAFGVAVRRRTAALVTGGFVVAAVGALGSAGMPLRKLLAAAFLLAVGGLVSVFTGRSSAWCIAVLRELAEAREVQARLAVAEERLRFGRDLHDVMGRNLSAIALKSELAVQLVQRGAEAAASVQQMAEVQRIARQSQSEVRAVVRGYREADLATELAGARGILRAAGVDCSAEDDATELPHRVQAALGWVVREGATNVLRHAEASWCTVGVGTDPAGEKALLVMENDGAVAAVNARTGSGLAGLRERLATLGGTLRVAEESTTGTFRLTAVVPLDSGTDDASPDDGKDAAA